MCSIASVHAASCTPFIRRALSACCRMPRPATPLFKSSLNSQDSRYSHSSFMAEVAAADAPRKRTSRWGLAAIEDNKPVSKRKRCRWSDIDPEAEKQANLHAAPAMGLPNERIRCARLQGRLNEITQVMTGGSLENIDLGRPRSPSPEPTYDAHGKRTNTRDQRLRDRYTREKQEIVVEISRINPDFDASAVGAVLTFKRTAKFPVPWREYPEYNFIGLIIGPRGTTQKRLEKETNTKIAIRGKGSVKDGKGRRDGVRDPSEDEDLHVLIEAYDDESLAAASKLVKDLLTPKDDETNEHKKQQLRELALMNGTLREEEYLTMVKGRVSNYGTPQIPGGEGQLPAGGSTAPWKPAMVPGGDASLPGDMPSRPGFQDDIADRFLNELSGRGPAGGGGGGSTPWAGAGAHGAISAAGLSQRHVLAQPDAPDPECNCYIGGLPPHWNEEAVRANCIPFGEIKSIRIMRDKDTQMSKCYGFVTFARRDSAQLAIQNLNQLAVEGKFLQMRLANVKGPDGATTVNPNMQRSQAAPWQQQQGYHQGGYQQPHGGHVFRPPQFNPPQNYGGYPQQQGYGMPMHGGYDGGNWQQQQQQQQYWGGQQQHQGYAGGGYDEPPPPPPPED